MLPGQVWIHCRIRRRPTFGETWQKHSLSLSTSCAAQLTSARFLSHSPHTCRAFCLIRLLWKGALVSGLDHFYGAYIASRGDTTDLEDDDGAINTSWWSCIRPKFRGAVSPIFPRSSHVGNEDRSRRQAIERTRSDWWSCVSGFVFPRQHKRRKQKALPRGTRTPTHPMGRDRASPGL